jgi:hypothetical protein
VGSRHPGSLRLPEVTHLGLSGFANFCLRHGGRFAFSFPGRKLSQGTAAWRKKQSTRNQGCRRTPQVMRLRLSEPPPLPPTAAALAGKAKDLQALRDALVDAASVGAGLWFSYLFVLLYLFIAVGGLTHSDLFLESPRRLSLSEQRDAKRASGEVPSALKVG